MEPHRARQLLGLAVDADRAAVRRRYHQLARDAHPDQGGDPDEFREIQSAYAVLREAGPGRRGPRNERVAANRARLEQQRQARERLPDVDVTTIDWDAAVPLAPRQATIAGLAAAAARAAPVAPVVLVSRGPHSATNRLAHALEDSLVARLEVGAALSAGRHGLRASGQGRRATRLLDALHAAPGWTTVRRSSDEVTATRPLPLDEDVRSTALLHATVAAELLEDLAWPLPRWRQLAPAK